MFPVKKYHFITALLLLSINTTASGQTVTCQQARQQLDLGNIVRAEQILDQLIQTNRCAGEALALKGRILAASDDLNGALRYYDQAQSCPGILPRDTVLEISMAYGLADRTPEAIALLEKYLAGNKTDAEMLHELGLNYLALEKFDLACSRLEQGYKLQADNLEMAVDYGSCLLYQGQPDKAITFLEKIADTNKQAALPLVFLGDAYMVKKDRVKALSAYSRAVAADNKNELALYRLARYYQQEAVWEKATATFKQLLNSAEYQAKALLSLVEINLAAGDIAQAQKWLQAAIKYDALDNDKAALYQAEIYRLQNNNNAAKKLLFAILKHNDKHPLAWKILLAIGEEEQDQQLITQAKHALGRK